MTRQEQHDKLQEACKHLHAARRLIIEARAGGDNDPTTRKSFFGLLQTTHTRLLEMWENLAEACHYIRQLHDIKAP